MQAITSWDDLYFPEAGGNDGSEARDDFGYAEQFSPAK
jgi:hypothetical protein